MNTPTRRTVLAGAALAAAAAPAAGAAAQTPPAAEDAPVFPSRADATKQAIDPGVGALVCLGYASAGDRGEGLYRRVSAKPAHGGTFQSRDGAWWELADAELNPFQFGAAGDGQTDDSAAIQAMFDCVPLRPPVGAVRFQGGNFYLAKGVTLPTLIGANAFEIDGGGGVLRSDKPIVMLSRVPANQAEAMRMVTAGRFDIHHLEFRGQVTAGQVGLHLCATYANVVRCCSFQRLAYGAIGTFCLASAWRDNLFLGCLERALVLQSGIGSDNGPVWPDATTANSASNVSVIENCRVFGHPKQRTAFGIFASDSVRVLGCISEGMSAATDLEFDYQGSTTVKQFHIAGFHCEAPSGTLNFRICATGLVTIERVVRSYPAAILDAKGCGNCEIILSGFAWLGGLPAPTGKPPNPNGRWFYHANGNGFGAPTEGGRSNSTVFRFEDCTPAALPLMGDPAHWESGQLPEQLTISGPRSDGSGTMQWSTGRLGMLSPIGFADGTQINGMLVGAISLPAFSVPAQGGIDQQVKIAGLSGSQHFAFANPGVGVVLPPAVNWNAYVAGDGVLGFRFTNAGSAPVSLPAAVWRYCAMRRL